MYQEVESIDELYKIVEQCLEEYNQTHKTQMNLVIFRSDLILLLFYRYLSVCKDAAYKNYSKSCLSFQRTWQTLFLWCRALG